MLGVIEGSERFMTAPLAMCGTRVVGVADVGFFAYLTLPCLGSHDDRGQCSGAAFARAAPLTQHTRCLARELQSSFSWSFAAFAGCAMTVDAVSAGIASFLRSALHTRA